MIKWSIEINENLTHKWMKLMMNFTRGIIFPNVSYLEIAVFLQKDMVPNLFEINAYMTNS